MSVLVLAARFPRLPALAASAGGRLLPLRVQVARRFWARLCGLLATRSLDTDEALWIVPCASVHTLGMGYPLDVVFLDHRQQVLAVRESVPPGRPVVGAGTWSAARRARSVLELRAGSARRLGLAVGVLLCLGSGLGEVSP